MFVASLLQPVLNRLSLSDKCIHIYTRICTYIHVCVGASFESEGGKKDLHCGTDRNYVKRMQDRGECPVQRSRRSSL